MTETTEVGNEETGRVTGVPENMGNQETESKTTEENNQEASQNTSEQSGETETSQETKQENTTKLQEGQWLIKEGVLGAGEIPPFLLEKYGYNMENQAKAYPDAAKKIGELNQRLGAFSGAPDKYDFSSIEDDKFIFDTQDKTFNEFVTECQNNNISQDFALKIAGFAKSIISQPQTSLENEAKAYGDSFEADKNNIKNWIGNNTSKEETEELLGSIKTAKALRALNNLMNANGFNIPTGQGVATAPKETLKDLQREFGENLYTGENLTDNPDKLKDWVERFNKKRG